MVIADITRFEWSSSEETDLFHVTDPSTGAVIGTIQGGGASEVDGAVRAAHAAYSEDWRWRRGVERGAMLQEIARRIAAQIDQLAALETRENGKPLVQSRNDLLAAISLFDYFGGLAGKLPGDFFDAGLAYGAAILEPYGVVGAIIPFNWPPIHTAGKLAPALAVGNTVVIKPPEQTPSVVMAIIEIAQEVLPPGVVHAVPGRAATGQALAAHPLVGKLSFTGAPATGSAVTRTAAANHTPTLMELGGKNAIVVLPDADLDQVLPNLLDAGYYNQGEACTAGSRILLHTNIHDEVVARLSEAVKRLKVGPGMNEGTHVGPVVTRLQQEKILGHLDGARAEGAQVAAEAPLPSDAAFAEGFWVKPTLLVNVTPSMRVAREEIFGPVTTVIRFSSVEEAVEIVNGTDFGLTCAIFTHDYPLAMKMARSIDVGLAFINNYYRAGVFGMPFGGTKASGYGREHTIATLKEFGRQKVMIMPSGLGDLPTWQGATDVGL